MNGLRMLVEGIGDAFSERYYSSCFAVEIEGAWLQVDCPHPFRKVLREASLAASLPLDLSRLEGVYLTHLHADHSSGIEGLIFYVRFLLGKRLRIFTHAAIAGDLWDRCLAGAMECSRRNAEGQAVRRTPEEMYELVLVEENKPVVSGPFVIHCRPTIHSIPTVALRLEAGGKKLGYSADTAFDPGLIDWLKSADLIVHEAGQGPMHTPVADLESLAPAIKRKMRLIHCGDDFNPANSTIECLRQGMLYHIGDDGNAGEKSNAAGNNR